THDRLVTLAARLEVTDVVLEQLAQRRRRRCRLLGLAVLRLQGREQLTLGGPCLVFRPAERGAPAALVRNACLPDPGTVILDLADGHGQAPSSAISWTVLFWRVDGGDHCFGSSKRTLISTSSGI